MIGRTLADWPDGQSELTEGEDCPGSYALLKGVAPAELGAAIIAARVFRGMTSLRQTKPNVCRTVSSAYVRKILRKMRMLVRPLHNWSQALIQSTG